MAVSVDPARLAAALGANIVIPLDGHHRPAHIGRTCDRCHRPFTAAGWNARHTPGLETVCEQCCDCTSDEADG